MDRSVSDPAARIPPPAPRLVVATGNPDKLREIRGILAGIRADVVGLDAFLPVAEPVEHGATFADNARAKALYYAQAIGALVVAEDSGLEIDALDGAPGVYSARFGGEAAVAYDAKFALIYEALAARGVATSPARFVAAIALATPGRVHFEARGAVEGAIAPHPRGTGGFGYDPIFYYPPLGCTLAEVPAGRKAEVSHRGSAFRALRRFIDDHGLPASGE